MKKFTIIDQIALATHNPELFKDKQQLKEVLEIKEKILLPAFFGGLVVFILLLAYQYQQWEDKQ